MSRFFAGRGLSPITWLIALFAFASPTTAEVARLEITGRQPHAEGRVFGEVGAYERIRGQVHFALNPEHAANGRIVDLDLAPRNAQGKVEFSADFEILAPLDVNRARGTLLYDVNNRGNRVALGQFNGGADHFLMRQGYIVVWSGWIAQVLPGGERLRLQAPVALDDGEPLVGMVRLEMIVDEPTDRFTISQWDNQGAHEPTARGEAEAMLSERARQGDARVPVERNRWRLEKRWIEHEGRRGQFPLIELVLDGGFQPGRIYELIYEAQGSVVQGAGLAGIRDLVSFLRYDASPENPLRDADGDPVVDATLGFGVSQSGRCLRMFLYDGFNADEHGRVVFDGLMPHVAGAGLGFFNHRFASPTRHAGQHDNHAYPVDQFPFTYQDATDPHTGRQDGILRRARAAGVSPKVMHVQTSAEYWHRAGSLVHTDPLGERDAPPPDDVRIYAIGGSQHGPGDNQPRPRSKGQLPANPTDFRPLMRGLLTALEAWVRTGREPPQNRYPSISAGDLVDWRHAASGWSAIPDIPYPQVIHQPELFDYGPEFAAQRRITRQPPASLAHYVVRTPGYGPDDNERGMLLPPTVAVPLATFTGWNLRHASIGAENELLGLAGAYIPFASTAEERRAAGDPRPSLEERYRDFDDYLARFTTAVDQLIVERYVLPEDRERLLEFAHGRRDAFAE